MREEGLEDDSDNEGLNEMLRGTENKHYNETSAVYSQRWKRLNSPLSDLQIEAIEAEVEWGREVKERMIPPDQCISTLGINIRRELRAMKHPGRAGSYSEEMQDEIMDVVYKAASDPVQDGFEMKVREAVSELEEFVRPHLSL